MANKHLQTIKLYETPYWKTWLGSMLVDNPNGLGAELHEHVYDGTGRITADQGRTAGDLLRAAEALGWIKRTALAPSVSQQAFDGLTHGDFARTSGDTRAHHAEWYMWRVVDREAVRAYVGDAMPSATKFALGDVVTYAPAFVAQVRGDAAMRRDRGVVVGFVEIGKDVLPRVAWDRDPTHEPACQAPVVDPPTCATKKKFAHEKCACRAVAYTARTISPMAIRRMNIGPRRGR